VDKSALAVVLAVAVVVPACVTTSHQGPGEREGHGSSAASTDDPLVEVHAQDAERRAGLDPDARDDATPPLPDAGAAAPLGHLAGCWQATSPEGDRWFVTYTRPMAGLVLGTTRHVRGGRLLMDEVERFSVDDDGTLVVTPIANGIPRDVFAWDDAASGPDSAVFQRRGEGFPQTLEYRRQGDELRIIARDDQQALGMKLRPAPCL